MRRKNATRNALFTSIISMLLCVSMLVGTTFAWFTDSVESGKNNIVAGNLDIELEYSKDTSSWATVKSATDLFSNALWEPGHTEVVYLRLSNKGTLALNYQLGINIASETEGTNVAGKTFKLSDYIRFGVVEGQSTKFADRAAAVAAVTDSKKLNEGYSKASSMVPDADAAYMALVVYMPETVGNEANYRGEIVPTIELGINVLATQKTHETDSFDNQYDALAQGGTTSDAAPTEGYKEYTVMSGDSNIKAATMQVHTDSVEDTTKSIEISIIPTTLNPDVTVTDEQKAATYEITVSNLKADNTTPIKVELNVGKGLTGVEVYHNENKIESVYNATTGYVIFETNSFSPYTVVHDAVAEEEEPTDTNMPTATVTEAPEFVGVDIEWSSYGGFQPSNEEQQMEAAYVFTTPHTSSTVTESEYKHWLCDFYVSVDREVPDGAIFLAGNYGSFGWVGFENIGLPVAADQEVPLLGTAIGGSTDGTTNWTYEQIVGFVSTFTCGVARTYGTDMSTLAGATFTVKLCLINPETNERIAVNTVSYTFEEVEPPITDNEGLNEALSNGAESVTLAAGSYTMPGTSGDVTISGTKETVIDLGKTGADNATFNGVTVKSTGYYGGLIDNDTIVYNNCTIDGTIYLYGEKVVFNNCTFDLEDTNDYIWVYATKNAEFNNCTFNTMGKAILIFQDGSTVNQTVKVLGCTFNASAPAYNWDKTIHISAVSIDGSRGGTYDVILNNNTVDSDFNGLWQDKTSAGNITVTVDGSSVLSPNA